jgi:hypothetical protein
LVAARTHSHRAPTRRRHDVVLKGMLSDPDVISVARVRVCPPYVPYVRVRVSRRVFLNPIGYFRFLETLQRVLRVPSPHRAAVRFALRSVSTHSFSGDASSSSMGRVDNVRRFNNYYRSIEYVRIIVWIRTRACARIKYIYVCTYKQELECSYPSYTSDRSRSEKNFSHILQNEPGSIIHIYIYIYIYMGVQYERTKRKDMFPSLARKCCTHGMKKRRKQHKDNGTSQ